MQTNTELIQALRSKILDLNTQLLNLSTQNKDLIPKNKELRRQLSVSRYNTRKQKKQTALLTQDNAMLEAEINRLTKGTKP